MIVVDEKQRPGSQPLDFYNEFEISSLRVKRKLIAKPTLEWTDQVLTVRCLPVVMNRIEVFLKEIHP